MKNSIAFLISFFLFKLSLYAVDVSSDTVYHYITGSGVGVFTPQEAILHDSADVYTLMWQEDSTIAIQLQGMNNYGFNTEEELWQQSLLLSEDDSLRAILRITLLLTSGELIDITDLEGLPLGYRGIRASWKFETNGLEVKNNYTILLNNNFILFIALTAPEEVSFTSLNQRAEGLYTSLNFVLQ